MSQYPPAVDNPSPSTYVAELPPGKGKGKDGVHKTFGRYDNSGRFGSLTGCVQIHVIEDDQWGYVGNLEISVEEGVLRAYYADDDGKGYRYIEATPGKPARARGTLLYQGGWLSFKLEAVGGDAEGASYHVWRSR